MSLVLSGTDGVSDIDGSAATPAIRGTDTNTGIFFPAADTIAFAEGGVESARLDSSGNLGLGVAPSAWTGNHKVVQFGATGVLANNTSQFTTLATNYFNAAGGDTYIANGFATRYYQLNGQHVWNVAPSGTAGNAISFTQAMTLDDQGRLALGQTSATRTLDVRGFVSSTDGTTRTEMVNGGGVGYFGTSTNHPLAFQTNNTERARIDSSGNLLVGKTAVNNSSTGVYIAGGGNADHGMINVARPPNTTMIQIVNSSGNTVVGQISQNGTNTTYSTSSDYRLKNTIAPMTGALARVAALKPCTYKWNADGSDGEGFIAHELQAVCPDAVTGEKDAVETYTDEEGNEQTRPKYQGIDTSFLVATLTAALQEAHGLIKDQAAAIQTLTARVTALEGTQP